MENRLTPFCLWGTSVPWRSKACQWHLRCEAKPFSVLIQSLFTLPHHHNQFQRKRNWTFTHIIMWKFQNECSITRRQHQICQSVRDIKTKIGKQNTDSGSQFQMPTLAGICTLRESRRRKKLKENCPVIKV